MTTATSPAVGLGELARDRSASNASKHHTEYQDRAEPRSAEAMDYIGNSNPLRQHYVEAHGNGYSEEYYSQGQQQQQPHYNSSNGYSHHSSTPPTSSPFHYPHGSAAGGTYLPPPIQTASFGNGMPANGNGTSNGVHSHAQSAAIHNSLTSPTSPALSPSPVGASSLYQQQQHGHYGYDQAQGQYHTQSYHAHHTSYPQEHYQHPLSPSTDGNSHNNFYPNYPIPAGKVDGNSNGNSNNNNNLASNGSYSSSSSSVHYSRNNSYSNHHGSIDDQPESPEGGEHALGMPMTPDGRDPSLAYSTSAPSPTSPVTPRTKRRSEVFASHESPYFYPAQQHFNLFTMDQSSSMTIRIGAKIDRGFFLAANDWTCYRRNYFQLSASFSVVGIDTSIQPEIPCLLERNGELLQVQKFLICIGAQIQNGEKTIELVQHTPKRDKGPQITPSPTPVRAGGDLSLNASAGSNPHVITFERVQFKTATANNGKRRAAQQYYQVRVDLFAETDMGEVIMIASSFSAPLVVRGRSPGHYADNEDGTGTTVQPMDGRYAYRNDSISSNGGGPVGSPVSEYPYYPNYGYGSSYQYQSLGSASHIAAQPQDGSYYERHNSESYSTSPLSPAVQHPGQIETSQPHHPHAYMAPQTQHGFSTASVSPDVYSPPGFLPSGTENSNSSLNRLPQLQSHAQGGHYPYGSPYAQYTHQQQQDQYDQDHEAQMAGLRIHSPLSPSSPVLASAGTVPRRQSFSSSLSSKSKMERPSVGPTRKSRSISMSGITKRAPSKTRTSRTLPTTPTKELGKGLGIKNEGIPESPMEEQQHA